MRKDVATVYRRRRLKKPDDKLQGPKDREQYSGSMLDEDCNRELHYEVLSVNDLCLEFVLVRNVVLLNREIRKFTVFRPPFTP
jgi:hypothetical protein